MNSAFSCQHAQIVIQVNIIEKMPKSFRHRWSGPREKILILISFSLSFECKCGDGGGGIHCGENFESNLDSKSSGPYIYTKYSTFYLGLALKCISNYFLDWYDWFDNHF